MPSAIIGPPGRCEVPQLPTSQVTPARSGRSEPASGDTSARSARARSISAAYQPSGLPCRAETRSPAVARSAPACLPGTPLPPGPGWPTDPASSPGPARVPSAAPLRSASGTTPPEPAVAWSSRIASAALTSGDITAPGPARYGPPAALATASRPAASGPAEPASLPPVLAGGPAPGATAHPASSARTAAGLSAVNQPSPDPLAADTGAGGRAGSERRSASVKRRSGSDAPA